MTGCRVSMDELEHDHQQAKTDERVGNMEETLKDAAKEEFQKDLESKSRSEFLGFGAFKPLYLEKDEMPCSQLFRNKSFIAALDDIFVTTVIAGDWETAAAIVMTRADQYEMDDELLHATAFRNLAGIAGILEERCEERFKQIHEHVTDNWSDYE